MSPLISTLKRVLKTRGVTYADLAERIALSEASVKRLFSQGTFTLERLEQVCAALEIDVFELAKLARGEQARAQELTVKQEQALAKDRVLLGVFYLAYNGWQIDDIVARVARVLSSAPALGRASPAELGTAMKAERVR